MHLVHILVIVLPSSVLSIKVVNIPSATSHMKPGKVGFTESPVDPIAQSIPLPLPKPLLQPDTRSPDLSDQVLGQRVTRNTIIQEANIHLEKHPSNQMLLTGP